MLFLGDLFCFATGFALTAIERTIVMGPAHRCRKPERSASGPRDPLAPPFNEDGNPMAWARRVAKWENAHEALCKRDDKRGYPAYFSGYLLSKALYGAASRTVESTLSEEVVNSKDGVSEIVNFLFSLTRRQPRMRYFSL